MDQNYLILYGIIILLFYFSITIEVRREFILLTLNQLKISALYYSNTLLSYYDNVFDYLLGRLAYIEIRWSKSIYNLQNHTQNDRMKKLLASLLLGSLIITQAQTVPDEGLDLFSDGDLMNTLNNYFGCRKWQDGVCLQCSQRYYFNKNGICCQVKPECREFNTQQGVCEGCYEGYKLSNGKCVAQDYNDINEKGCARRKNGKCVECSKRWFFTNQGVCSPVSDYCRTWSINGRCQSCYNGYQLNKIGDCQLDTTADNFVMNNPLCAYWDDKICVKCAERAFKDSTGRCLQVKTQCNTWDRLTGSCLSCYKGYQLSNEKNCVRSQVTGPKDQGCKSWDWDKQICLACSPRFVRINGICVSVNDSCSSWNDDGLCATCYKGYNVLNGVCVRADQTAPKDKGCKAWDWDRQICLECSYRHVGRNGRCISVDDSCSTWNQEGLCNTCYKGYKVSNGVCVQSQQTGPKDQGCKRWDWDKQICLQCSNKFISKNGVCVPVGDLCASWNHQGQCITCYKGYTLKGDQCVRAAQTGPKDQGCKSWDWDNQVCLACSPRFVFKNGKCTPVDPLCSAWNDQGLCTNCFKGYQVQNGICVRIQQSGPKDPGCKSWDWDRQICLECSGRFVPKNNICVPVDPSCQTWNNQGLCTTCYKGYTVSSGQCVASNLSCKTTNSNGECSSCYTGYVLYKKNCVTLSKLANLAAYYAECCPEKLAALKAEGRI